MRGKIMKFDDLWIQILIEMGAGAIGGFGRYLESFYQAKQANPKHKVPFFTMFILLNIGLGVISAVAVSNLIVAIFPSNAPQLLIFVAILFGFFGIRGLMAIGNVFVKNFAKNHFAVEIKEIEIENLNSIPPPSKPRQKKQ